MEVALTTKADGRRVATEAKRYQLCELADMQHEILRRLSIGEKPEYIAAALDITPQTVSNVRNTAMGQAKLAMLRHARDKEFMVATKRATEMLPKAMDILEVLLRQGESIASYDPTAALKIVTTTTDLAGFSKKEGALSLHLHQHGGRGGATAEDLEAVKKAALAAQAEGAIEHVVEVEYEESDIVDAPVDTGSDVVMKLLEADGFLG